MTLPAATEALKLAEIFPCFSTYFGRVASNFQNGMGSIFIGWFPNDVNQNVVWIRNGYSEETGNLLAGSLPKRKETKTLYPTIDSKTDPDKNQAAYFKIFFISAHACY